MSDKDFITAKKELEAVMHFAQEAHNEAINKARTAIESAILSVYGLQKGTIVSLDTNSNRTYAVQCFYITTPNILRNKGVQDVIDRVQVILRETNDLGELILDKASNTISCFIADIKNKKNTYNENRPK